MYRYTGIYIYIQDIQEYIYTHEYICIYTHEYIYICTIKYIYMNIYIFELYLYIIVIQLYIYKYTV